MTTAAKRLDARAKVLLTGITVCIVIAASTATGTYSYPETLKSIEGPMIFLHDASGDVALLLSGLYLIGHLPRTWRMKSKKFMLSRWTGIFVVGIWVVAGVTGLYGHFIKLEDHTALWWLHFVTAMASCIIACFHGIWAFRPRRKPVQA